MKLSLATLSLSILLLTSAHAQTYRIATYNIRYDNKGDSLNPWQQRKTIIASLVQFHDFDIMGTQEGLYHQLQELTGLLREYTYIGIGRDDGKQAGEFSAIFYKKDKFKLLKSGHFWLSQTSEKPSTGWDAALPRICTWGQFKDNVSGFTFFVFNVHFDHRGVQARKESAQLVAAKIKEIAGKSPAVLTGDFNFSQKNENYNLLTTADLRDAYEAAAIRYAPSGTFNRFDVTFTTDERIDHIFITKDFKITRYGILTDSYNGKFPSDHFPVITELKH